MINNLIVYLHNNWTIETYVFAFLLAYATIKFISGLGLLKEPDYKEIEEGKEIALHSLTMMFFIVIFWLIIHSIIVMIV